MILSRDTKSGIYVIYKFDVLLERHGHNILRLPYTVSSES
jgi:hypothetical protein